MKKGIILAASIALVMTAAAFKNAGEAKGTVAVIYLPFGKEK